MRSLDHYMTCLKSYNEHTNVYSKKAYQHLPFHVENSVGLATFIPQHTRAIVDVGSGSGLPAVPLAIVRPELSVTAIESRLKKVTFLRWIKDQCKCDNLEVIHDDVRAVFRKPTRKWSIVTAKAFAHYDTLCDIVRLMPHKPERVLMPISENQYQSEYQADAYPVETLSRETGTHYYIAKRF